MAAPTLCQLCQAVADLATNDVVSIRGERGGLGVAHFGCVNRQVALIENGSDSVSLIGSRVRKHRVCVIAT